MRQKTFGKWLAAAGILMAMTIWMVLPALAAPTVNSIRITFKDKYEDPGVIEEPEISCGSYGIEITSVEWSKDVEKWNPGTKVTATLILSSSGREFSSSYGSKSCQISGATLSKAVKVDDDLKVTVTYYPVVWLETPDEAGWSASNHMKAVWKKVDIHLHGSSSPSALQVWYPSVRRYTDLGSPDPERILLLSIPESQYTRRCSGRGPDGLRSVPGSVLPDEALMP